MSQYRLNFLKRMRYLYASGIVHGLELSQSAKEETVAGNQLYVTCGMALNRTEQKYRTNTGEDASESTSQEIFLLQDALLVIDAGKEGDCFFVYISYDESPMDVRDNQKVHIGEEACVGWSRERPDDQDKFIVLGKVEFSADGEIDPVSLAANARLRKVALPISLDAGLSNLSVSEVLTVGGDLKLSQGTSVNKISNETLGENAKSLPTELVVKTYVDAKYNDAVAGSDNRDFKAGIVNAQGFKIKGVDFAPQEIPGEGVAYFDATHKKMSVGGEVDGNSDATLAVRGKLSVDGDIKLAGGINFADNTSLNSTADLGDWDKSSGNIYYDSGNVGIGTKDPKSKLHVSGGTGPVDVLIEADTNNSGDGGAEKFQPALQNKRA